MPLTLDAIPPELTRLADELTNGFAPLGWRGDPRLTLQVGALTVKEGGYDRKGSWRNRGELVALRVEVVRHNEDGTDTPILQRPMERWHEIIPELVKIDPASPMFRNTMDVIQAHNDKLEREQDARNIDAKADHIEHLWKLVADRQNGRTTFRGMPGSAPDKQS